MNANELTFGVEIECCIPVAKLTEAGWTVGGYHSGEPVPGFPGWTAERDGSIRTPDYQYAAVELVSPILKGAEGLAQVVAMIAKVKEMGGQVNKSCGFHVHVGWSGDAKSLARLICLAAFHEDAMYGMTGTLTREQGNYCRKIKNMESYKAIGRTGNIRRFRGERYHMLNLTGLAYGGQTVEWRVFSATLNPIKAQAYIQVALGLVQKAHLTVQRSPWDAKQVKTGGPLDAGAPAQTAVRRLMKQLGWIAGYRVAASLDNATETPRLGLLVTDEATVDRMRKELMRLAKQYDDRTEQIA